jgi:GNAT superfamily N-acetyltransferase
MLTLTVEAATALERERVVSTLVLAFVSDPMSRWVWPEPHQYLTHFPTFVQAFGGKGFDLGTAHRAGGFSGASLWLPPGVEPDEARLGPLIESTVEARKVRSVFTILEHMSGYHPTEPHWYLPLIGVEPAMQGHGLGSALLAHVLERVDREGRVAYLESTNPANVPLYERHGFVVAGTIQVDDAPPMYPMVRAARA